MNNQIEQKSLIVFKKIITNQHLKQFVNEDLPIPSIYKGSGIIKLIFLGQDPTVKNIKTLNKITQVLNLNKSGNLLNYINKICKGLDLRLEENIYATNYFKNFFIKPPTQFMDDILFSAFAQEWLPLLQQELSQYADIPVITLGQPVLSLVIQGNTPKLVREYWGYTPEWRSGKTLEFKYINPDANVLKKKLFPFPHQPSIAKKFYSERFGNYIKFMKKILIT